MKYIFLEKRVLWYKSYLSEFKQGFNYSVNVNGQAAMATWENDILFILV